MHSARNAYATLTLCALTLGFAPRPRVSRCTRLRLSPDREELRKLRVKELQAELGKRNIRWQSFLEKEELVVALSEALEAAGQITVEERHVSVHNGIGFSFVKRFARKSFSVTGECLAFLCLEGGQASVQELGVFAREWTNL